MAYRPESTRSIWKNQFWVGKFALLVPPYFGVILPASLALLKATRKKASKIFILCGIPKKGSEALLEELDDLPQKSLRLKKKAWNGAFLNNVLQFIPRSSLENILNKGGCWFFCKLGVKCSEFYDPSLSRFKIDGCGSKKRISVQKSLVDKRGLKTGQNWQYRNNKGRNPNHQNCKQHMQSLWFVFRLKWLKQI